MPFTQYLNHSGSQHFQCIFYVKYSYQILRGDIAKSVLKSIRQVTDEFDYQLLCENISTNHLYIMLSTDSDFTPVEFAKRFYSVSSTSLFMNYPHLKRRYWDYELWSHNYLCLTRSENNGITEKWVIHGGELPLIIDSMLITHSNQGVISAYRKTWQFVSIDKMWTIRRCLLAFQPREGHLCM